MNRVQGRLSLLCVLGASLWLGACGPTYRKEHLVEAIQRLCATEYRLTVSVKQVGQTIAVSLQHDGIFQQLGTQVGLAQSANEILSDLIEAIHRVILNSDEPMSFYVVVASDPALPGVYLTLVRYMDDVRRVNANALSPTEFFSRTILELKSLEAPAMSLEQLVPNDIRLEQFLSWQLAKRIQARLAERLQSPEMSIADVGQCVGEFRNGEFAFLLNVIPKPGEQFSNEVVQQIFQEASTEIAHVLLGYRFESFSAIRLIHPPTGRSLILPKTRLELFR